MHAICIMTAEATREIWRMENKTKCVTLTVRN